MVVPGKNFLVYVKGDGIHGDPSEIYPIACDKNCSLIINTSFLEITTKDTGYFRNFLPTFVDWKMSGNGLVNFGATMGVHSLQQLELNRQAVVVKMQAKQSEDESIVYSGTGYLKNVVTSGPVSGAGTFSYELIGINELSITSSIPSEGGGGGEPNIEIVERKQFIATEGQTTYQNNVLIGAKLLNLFVGRVPLYKGPGDYQMAGLDPTTGTITWNYPVAEGTECIINYSK